MAGTRNERETVPVIEDDELEEGAQGETEELPIDDGMRDWDVKRERERGRAHLTLTELTVGLDADNPTKAKAEDLPSVREMAAAVLRQIRLLEFRHEDVSAVLKAGSFEFDWNDQDLAVEQRVGIVALSEAGELVDELRDGLFRWLKCFNQTRLLEIDMRTMLAVNTIASEGHWFLGARDVDGIVQACVQYVAAEPDVLAVVRERERARRAAFDARSRRRAAQIRGEADSEPDGAAAEKAALRAEFLDLRRTIPEIFTLAREVADEEAARLAGHAEPEPEPNPNDTQPGAEVADDVSDLDGLAMTVQLYYEESGLGEEVDLNIPTIVADCDRGRIRRELAELAARFSSRYHARQLGHSVAVILTGDEDDNNNDPAEAPVQPGRQGANTTPANVHANSEDDKAAATV